MSTKYCGKCKQTKNKTEFTKNSSASDGLYSMCRDCKTNAQYMATYGITLSQYNDMFDLQEGCCAICDLTLEQTGKKRLYVDHCHTTGKVRGLLCQHCNFVLGQAKDSTAILEAAIMYLKERG
jgi:hypothetical protein